MAIQTAPTAANCLVSYKTRRIDMDDTGGLASHAIMKATHPAVFRWDVGTNLVTGDLNLAWMFELNTKRVRRGFKLEMLAEMIHPADRATVFASLAQALERCAFFWAQFRILRPSRDLQARAFGRCQKIEGTRVVSGVIVDLTGILPEISLSQEDADLEQIAHNCALARTLAIRHGFSEMALALQFALDDAHWKSGAREVAAELPLTAPIAG